MLVAECYECHNAEKTKGGLRLDYRGGWQKGSDRGDAIVPGDPQTSLLIDSIKQLDPDLKMPDKAPKLDDAVIADFEKWIAMGAPDPRDDPPPFVRDTSHSSHQTNGTNATHAAAERLTPRLLTSPRFGEHWARHWMDLMRYADTHGSEGDPVIPEAWREDRLTEPQRTLLDDFSRSGVLPVTLPELPKARPLVAEYRRLEAAVPIPQRAPGVLETAPTTRPSCRAAITPRPAKRCRAAFS